MALILMVKAIVFVDSENTRFWPGNVPVTPMVELPSETVISWNPLEYYQASPIPCNRALGIGRLAAASSDKRGSTRTRFAALYDISVGHNQLVRQG